MSVACSATNVGVLRCPLIHNEEQCCSIKRPNKDIEPELYPLLKKC